MTLTYVLQLYVFILAGFVGYAIITRVPPVQEPSRAPKMHFLGVDQKWTEAPELGILGDVFEQDMANLPFVQRGLKSSKNGKVELANYQEIQIRQFQNTLMKYLNGEL